MRLAVNAACTLWQRQTEDESFLNQPVHLKRMQLGSRNYWRDYEVRLEVRRRGRPEPYHVTNAREIYLFMEGLESESAEHTYELLFDTKHRVHGVYLVGKGGIDRCSVDPVEVFKAALVSNSPAFALVHNHPSGIPEPSPDDIALTSRLQDGAKLLGLEFTDSIIIADSRYYSFYEAGRLLRRSE